MKAAMSAVKRVDRLAEWKVVMTAGNWVAMKAATKAATKAD